MRLQENVALVADECFHMTSLWCTGAGSQLKPIGHVDFLLLWDVVPTTDHVDENLNE